MLKGLNIFTYILVIILFSVPGCAGPVAQRVPGEDDQSLTGSNLTDPNEHAFFNNLAKYCGQSFRGYQTFMAEGRESWEDKDFVMHVSVCKDDMILIPFHLDNDHSRTWMFLEEEGRLRFRHDHRHDDGTPEDITMYGGYGDKDGTALRQDFPADDYTCDLIPASCHAVWRVELIHSPGAFNYMLFSRGELIFSATFDLEIPVAQDDISQPLPATH